MKSKSIKTRSGVTVRWRNGRRNVQVRLKGFPFRSRSFPEGTTEEEAREWGLETARKLKLRDVPTLAHKVTKELTLKYLIEDYQRQCHLAFLTGKMSTTGGYVQGYRLKRSWENENVFLNAFKEREVALCRKTLDQITANEFADYRDRRLATGIKPATLRRELNPIRHIYKLARQKFQIPNDPFKNLILPKEDEGRKRTMSEEERTKLFEAIQACRSIKQGRLWTALIVAALTTAARGGELLKLQWGNIDFEQKTLHFPAEITKSGKSRTIPMSKALRDDLRAYRHLISEEDKTPTSLVFPLTHSAKEQGWRRLCKRAQPPIKGLHFHDLKHTAMTSFASKPIELNTRETAYMGDHKEARMGSRYEHLEMIESIRAKLDIGYGPDEESPRFAQVQILDLIKFNDEAQKKHKKRLAKDKVEKVAVFKVTDNDTRLTPLGYFTKHDAYKLIGIDVEHPHLQLQELVSFHTGRYIFKNHLGEKHLVVDPAIVSVKDVLEGLLGSQQAAQETLDGLQDDTTIFQSHKLRLVSNG